MSVLIKGIKMPESCHVCALGYGGCCYAAPAEEDGVCPDHGRAEWCPLEEAEPVVHGKWVLTSQSLGWRDEDCAECSVCGEDFMLDEWDIDEVADAMHYCPSCGAKMDEVDE